MTTAAEYHADPCPEPSLSSSIAHRLVTQTPRHAWQHHPRLNPDWQPEPPEDKFDLGTVVHALLLEGEDKRVQVDFNDWRTDTAKAQRDEIRASGRIPVLAKYWSRVDDMIGAVLAALEASNADPPLLRDGVPELTLMADFGTHWMRCKPDWLRDDLRAMDDLKTTSRMASSWNPVTFGGDIQAALYRAVVGGIFRARPPAWRWIVVESFPPYGVRVLEPSGDVLAFGEARLSMALRIWADCLAQFGTDPWPAYPATVERLELPPWEEPRFLERMEATS